MMIAVYLRPGEILYKSTDFGFYKFKQILEQHLFWLHMLDPIKATCFPIIGTIRKLK